MSERRVRRDRFATVPDRLMRGDDHRDLAGQAQAIGDEGDEDRRVRGGGRPAVIEAEPEEDGEE